MTAQVYFPITLILGVIAIIVSVKIIGLEKGGNEQDYYSPARYGWMTGLAAGLFASGCLIPIPLSFAIVGKSEHLCTPVDLRYFTSPRSYQLVSAVGVVLLLIAIIFYVLVRTGKLRSTLNN